MAKISLNLTVRGVCGQIPDLLLANMVGRIVML